MPIETLFPAPLAATARLDVQVHTALARASASLPPASTLLAGLNWAAHLAMSPGRQMELGRLALRQAEQLSNYLRDCPLAGPGEARACVEPPAQDRRFAAPQWRQWPFNLWHQSFLLTEQWWDAAAHDIAGVEKHHENVVAFAACQWLDLYSPGNQLATNPLVLQRTAEQVGANLVRDALNLVDDLERTASGAPPAGVADFAVGRDVPVTPAKVALKNQLIELIQHTPSTTKVHPEPILIVPDWIIKHYIPDLSLQNSLVKYLVDQGHTVFCISWKNPGVEKRDRSMDDHLEIGFHAALDAINAIVLKRKVHAAGYFLGSTLLAIAAARARDARANDHRLASLTLLGAQTEFSEPGELSPFIDESQVSLLEAQMAEVDYLTAAQMAGAFSMLRSYDLLWSRLISKYLLGDHMPTNDLMAWNANATRMPAMMHLQYLRRLFPDDELSEGRYPVDGKAASLGDIMLPVFMVGTDTDHVAPWRSVHKRHFLTPAEITFVLTSGGHNAGVVSPPSHPRRHCLILERAAGGGYVPPDDWPSAARDVLGSWWPAWQRWLAARSGAPVKPPHAGAAGLCPAGDAAGTYVLEK